MRGRGAYKDKGGLGTCADLIREIDVDGPWTFWVRGVRAGRGGDGGESGVLSGAGGYPGGGGCKGRVRVHASAMAIGCPKPYFKA